ncbi:MAG: hypothetical protein KatS3mg003_2279 [Candidatus Nitrosocaldaceae archaeon]|nr:MAG: hypothetical protein KatS3mg003_2279 [Candidatus Nitrosocaldaceae archaeon]
MSAGSVSRIKGIIELRGKGSCECEFIRHLAPLTVGSILRALPLEGRVLVEDEYVGLVTNLSIGAEKQRDSFKRGDIAFMVANNAICIFKKDVSMKGFNPVGRVISNIEVLEKASMGDIMIIKS